ncbi:MAG: alkaline phosphatase family protein, partial [Gemmata sp.]
MPSIRVTLAALCLMAFVAGIGGYFLLRPPAPEPRPPHGKFDPKAPPPEGPTSGASAAPKLVVFVVFDQMRGDYLSRWAECYSPDGFERVKREGVWFSECHVPYACTSTGPGHAALSTGAPPSANGIVENVWYDRSAGAHVYCCQPRRVYDLVPPVPAEFGKPSR